MKIRGTDFVMLEVSDLARAAQFYREVLELRQEIYSEHYQWAEFDCGSVTLALKGGVTGIVGRPGARLALAVEDMAAAQAELRHKAAQVTGPPQDHGVCQHLEVMDPDGNVILLHHRADGTFGRPQIVVPPTAVR